MLRAVRVSEPHRPRRGGLNRGSASPVVTAQSSFLTGACVSLSTALVLHPALMRKRWHKFARFSADHVWASAAVWEEDERSEISDAHGRNNADPPTPRSTGQDFNIEVLDRERDDRHPADPQNQHNQGQWIVIEPMPTCTRTCLFAAGSRRNNMCSSKAPLPARLNEVVHQDHCQLVTAL